MPYLFAFLFGAIAGFVLTRAEANRRAARPHGRMLKLIGLALLSASATLAVLLFGWVALYSLGYLAEPSI